MCLEAPILVYCYSNIKFLGYANMGHKILFEPGKKLIYDDNNRIIRF